MSIPVDEQAVFLTRVSLAFAETTTAQKWLLEATALNADHPCLQAGNIRATIRQLEIAQQILREALARHPAGAQ